MSIPLAHHADGFTESVTDLRDLLVCQSSEEGKRQRARGRMLGNRQVTVSLRRKPGV